MTNTEMVTVLIADDEALARERIRMLLATHPQYTIVSEVEDGEQAAADIARLRPALAFLDISMPGRNGVQVADGLVDDNVATAIIFVTAHDEYALQAFEVGALDYLVKPVDRQRFDQTLARIERRGLVTRAPEYRDELRVLLETLNREAGYRKRFVVRSTKGHYFVQTKDIESVTADGNYLVLQAGGRTHLIRETLKSFADSVDSAQFVRIHRSIIVNVEFISRIEPEGYGEYRVITTGGTRLESSRAYGDQLRALLK